MLATMPPRKKKARPRPGVPLFVRLDEDTAAALDSFIKAQEFKPEKTAVVVSALRHFLADRGYLPKSK